MEFNLQLANIFKVTYPLFVILMQLTYLFMKLSLDLKKKFISFSNMS